MRIFYDVYMSHDASSINNLIGSSFYDVVYDVFCDVSSINVYDVYVLVCEMSEHMWYELVQVRLCSYKSRSQMSAAEPFNNASIDNKQHFVKRLNKL